MNGFLEEWRRKSGKWQKITYSRERPNAISAEFLGELFGQTFGRNKFGHFMLFRLFGRNAEIWPFGTLSAFRPNVRPNSGIFAECSAKYLVEFWLNILPKCRNSVFRHYFGVLVLFRHFGRNSVGRQYWIFGFGFGRTKLFRSFSNLFTCLLMEQVKIIKWIGNNNWVNSFTPWFMNHDSRNGIHPTSLGDITANGAFI